MARATCLTCKEPIPDIWAKDVAVLEYRPPMMVGKDTQAVHLRCVSDPGDLNPREHGRWAMIQFAHIREENQRLWKEIQMIHRALHNLPAEWTERYMNECYDLGKGPGEEGER